MAVSEQFGSRVMLVGSPRSGTTWMAKIIDSHPQVLYRHEPDSTLVTLDNEILNGTQGVKDEVPVHTRI